MFFITWYILRVSSFQSSAEQGMSFFDSRQQAVAMNWIGIFFTFAKRTFTRKSYP